MMNKAVVIGAGLAGSEAAWQLANRGICVKLIDMKPDKMSPAHKSAGLAELVCSNSLRSNRLENAVGLLKEEMRRLGSLVISAADKTCVPAGGALAVDRELFSKAVTEAVINHPNIEFSTMEASGIPDENCIVATGPLTSDALIEDIKRLTGKSLHFFDAAAPIIEYDSIDMSIAFKGSRYERGDDYINCPMNKQQYFDFYNALINAKTAELKDFEAKVFEGCMPVEVLAKRGEMSLAFGPLKPVGIRHPVSNEKYFAVVQLRQDNAQGSLFNIVGFQTNLLFEEQRRVFRMIPGLENAEFMRYGVMHRNTFINSPGKLNANYRLGSSSIYFAGQITGVEGYVESAGSGLVAGISLAKQLRNEEQPTFSKDTAIGSLAAYVSGYNGSDFQPMNANFGIIERSEIKVRNKQQRYLEISKNALNKIDEAIQKFDLALFEPIN